MPWLIVWVCSSFRRDPAMDTASLGLFSASLAVAYLLPGPDMLLVLQTGLRQGRGPALSAAVGLAVARALHVLCAALGLAVLLRTSPAVFGMVRMIGMAYLVWLGNAILRSSSLTFDAALPVAGGREPAPCRAALSRGVLTNLLNPKPLLFCSVLLPQFVKAGRLDVVQQFVILGTILVVLGLMFDSVYATLGGALQDWLNRSPRWQLAQRWLFGALLVGFGLALAFVRGEG